MSTRKRPISYDAISATKRQRKQHAALLESQDLWKNLDKVRTNNPHSDTLIKNSYLFIPIFTKNDISDIRSCIEALHEYIGSEKLQLHISKNNNPHIAYVSMKDFNILDCCLVLSVIFTFKSKKWVTTHTKSYFSIPQNINLAGSFYLPSNCISLSKFDLSSMVNISESNYNNVFHFKEFYLSSSNNKSLTHFTNGVASFFSHLKFGKPSTIVCKQFQKSFNRHQADLSLNLQESSLPKEILFDRALLTKTNLPLVEKSKANLLKYARDLQAYNSASDTTNTASNKELKQTKLGINNEAHKNLQNKQEQQQNASSYDKDATGSRYSSSANTKLADATSIERARYTEKGAGVVNTSNFMTQEQIKQHCVATISASMDVLKTKSPYQIFKTYVKCPRQTYIDMVYQSLNDLRSQTNCNIVVLNLNNLHESKPWFDSLDVSKYTDFVRQPHPSTVRVVSIGGIGEHMVKALQLISKIMDS